MIDDQSLERYSRQILVPGVELEGQERLSQAHVLIVGCGGLGNISATYLAAAGVGTLTLMDPDTIELSNLPRQVAYGQSDIGQSKAEVLAKRVRSNNGAIAVRPLTIALDADNAEQLFTGVDLVLDATDSRSARVVMNRTALATKTPWIMAAAVQMMGMWLPLSGEYGEGCYECLSPESVSGTEGGCERLGILGPVVGTVGLAQALVAIKLLTDCAPVVFGQLCIEDFKHGSRQQLTLRANSSCPCCGNP